MLNGYGTLEDWKLCICGHYTNVFYLLATK